ncbi:hypothetical protein BpHYR1_019428 [Brachionus plicatilis]|uniref:Uncharacterized protein n=1 Tax=Brachionus plicatilis TaxID=10195 RepID=A0A3M7PE05_BRAPC|nr:hypothetical protein BpHYR1_019428 [Brachionus plicatilis]
MIESSIFRQFSNYHQPYVHCNQRTPGEITDFQDRHQLTRNNTFINSINNRSRPISPNQFINFQTKFSNKNAQNDQKEDGTIQDRDWMRNMDSGPRGANDFEENISFLRSQVFEFVKSSSANRHEQNKIELEKMRQRSIRNEVIKTVLRDIFYSFDQNGFITLQTARNNWNVGKRQSDDNEEF